MTTAWQTETGHSTCQWSGAHTDAPYHPSWMQEPPARPAPENLATRMRSFTRLSPFGGMNWWYGPVRYR